MTRFTPCSTPKAGYKFYVPSLGTSVRVYAEDFFTAIQMLKEYTTAPSRYLGHN